MPIKIKDNLPAIEILGQENIFVMTESRAYHQDIRVLKIAILDLTPSENIFEVLRSLSNSPLQIEITLLRPAFVERNEHLENTLERFYKSFEETQHIKFDGLILTGASQETKSYETLPFWEELCKILNWSIENVFSNLYVGWGAQLALYHHYKIESPPLEENLLGVYPHQASKKNIQLLKGFDDVFQVPHARSTGISSNAIEGNPMFSILAESHEARLAFIEAASYHQIFVTGNVEFKTGTLKAIYEQSVLHGRNPKLPSHYFPNGDPNQAPKNNWKSHSTLLFTNWLNYYVYQETPYDLSELMYFI